MYKIYENQYFNPLLLNLINVRYAPLDRLGNCTLSNNDYTISLSKANMQYDNPSITMKVMLYICNLLTDSGLNENTFTIPTNKIHNDLGIRELKYFENSLNYLSSISYDYQYRYANKDHNTSTTIIDKYKANRGYFKVTISDDFINLLDRTRQFYQVPRCLLNANIRYFRHSIFIGNYLFLHRRRNQGKPNEFTISVKELLKNCPLIPKYEELDEQRQVHRTIIEPFKKNLDYLGQLLGFTWHYNNEPTKYLEFINEKIIFDMQI